jgi:alpha-glucosidase/alpha-D-xyloside xylohydrolase
MPIPKCRTSEQVSRREAIKRLGAAGAGTFLGFAGRPSAGPRAEDIVIAGKPVEIVVASLSPATVRISALPIENGVASTLPMGGAIAAEGQGREIARRRSASRFEPVRAEDVVVRFTASPPTLRIETRSGRLIQRLTFDPAGPGISFPLGSGPLLGLGPGGPQFDRKGTTDAMRSGQAAYRLRTHGGRVPIQWLVGTDGWGMFIHRPFGTFDFTGAEGQFLPSPAASLEAVRKAPPEDPAEALRVALPLDLFIVAASDPRALMREYARITGLPEMPARWTLGYMQSHRTLAGPEEVLGVARTMREKKLPCDALIYLGTEFTPSGWNTRNGEFAWHEGNFPDPKGMIATLHGQDFKIVLHVVIEGRRLTGSVEEPCDPKNAVPSGRTPDDKWPEDRSVPGYWPYHKPLFDLGVDGYWPDQGDGLDPESRLNRNRMYWEGSRIWRPNERPFALHRNGYAGMQRYAAFLWSGDVQSLWETLRTHVPAAVNTGLSGIPYWGTDIGGFVPTAEYTGELHVRWFQFGAFCPSFRAHGRHWHLKLPWGWDGGDGGPKETTSFTPDPAELKNPRVEPILKKYLELRYRLLPYTYTTVRDGCETGMPIIRALWLHYPEDAEAVRRGDQYLWGRDILVSPVVEKGATSRRLYLPKAEKGWYDFWTEERLEGGREIERPVDLETMPLHVRAGAILPFGPVRQFAEERVDEPMGLIVYSGADGAGTIYEDDGKSFDYRKGEWMRIEMTWRDAERRLTLRLGRDSRMLPPAKRTIVVRIAGEKARRTISFEGKPLYVRV